MENYDPSNSLPPPPPAPGPAAPHMPIQNQRWWSNDSNTNNAPDSAFQQNVPTSYHYQQGSPPGFAVPMQQVGAEYPPHAAEEEDEDHNNNNHHAKRTRHLFSALQRDVLNNNDEEEDKQADPYVGRCAEEFRVVLKNHWCFWIWMLIGFGLLLAGVIGMTAGMPVPGPYILMGIGGGLYFVFGVFFGMKFWIIEKKRGQSKMTVTVLQVAPPFIFYHSFETSTDVNNVRYEIASWITTSTDKQGVVHYHHHSALVIDGVGVGADFDDEDCEELTKALGRRPRHRGGEPDENVCWCCVCCCGCY